MSDRTYEERLQILKMTTLETRIRGDLIEVFKIFKGYDKVNITDLFSVVDSCTRGCDGREWATPTRAQDNDECMLADTGVGS